MSSRDLSRDPDIYRKKANVSVTITDVSALSGGQHNIYERIGFLGHAE